jgi:hypothetical protein
MTLEKILAPLWKFLEGPVQHNRGDAELVILPSGLSVISKRCKACGIHPSPSQMELLWGHNWQEKLMCKECTSKTTKKILVFIVPKLIGRDPKDIKEWYMPLNERLYMKKIYIQSDNNTKFFISDGDRFWDWNRWPHLLENFLGLDEFEKLYPDWKVVEPEAQIYPNISSYISC